MCWQAWQANPNAMWNWNGLFREGVAGNHQAAIPDGQLCSAGHTQGGRYTNPLITWATSDTVSAAGHVTASTVRATMLTAGRRAMNPLDLVGLTSLMLLTGGHADVGQP